MAWSRFFLLAVAFAGVSLLGGCGAVFVNEGSKDASLAEGLHNPEANKVKIQVPPDQCVVGDFDDGSKNVNSKLFGASGGQWMALSSGGGGAINSDLIADGGANGTTKAAHVYGKLTDKGDKSYPGFQLQCRFKDTGLYDASNFNGIQFYYKCPSDDTALKRRFGIGMAATLPSDQGGTCSNNCYDNFGADMPSSNDWVKITLVFTDIKREGWGGAVIPPDMTDHLAEFINLQWNNSANNMAGTYNINYWVDQVTFF
jgi:hypothetical protein